MIHYLYKCLQDTSHKTCSVKKDSFLNLDRDSNNRSKDLNFDLTVRDYILRVLNDKSRNDVFKSWYTLLLHAVLLSNGKRFIFKILFNITCYILTKIVNASFI